MFTFIIACVTLAGLFYLDIKQDQQIWIPVVGWIKYPYTITSVLIVLFIIFAR